MNDDRNGNVNTKRRNSEENWREAEEDYVRNYEERLKRKYFVAGSRQDQTMLGGIFENREMSRTHSQNFRLDSLSHPVYR